MRIQETDRILKDARATRHAAEEPQHQGLLARTWQKVVGIFRKH